MRTKASVGDLDAGRSGHELRELVEQVGPGLADSSAEEVVSWAAGEFGARWCVTSSFADAVLAHLISQIAPGIDVLFLDTGYHFPETLRTRDQVAATLPVQVISVRPAMSVPEQDAEFGERLYSRDPESCCRMRKVDPLAGALAPYEAWAAGLRRDQSPQRRGTRTVDFDAVYGKVKICPLAAWKIADVRAYARRHDIVVNPLVDQGYSSIGCQPCTSAVATQDERAGRWPLFDKTECGIHRAVPAEPSGDSAARTGAPPTAIRVADRDRAPRTASQ